MNTIKLFSMLLFISVLSVGCLGREAGTLSKRLKNSVALKNVEANGNVVVNIYTEGSKVEDTQQSGADVGQAEVEANVEADGNTVTTP